MNACEECITYQLHHNLLEAEICPVCGQKSFIWKQNGDFHLECSNCGTLAAVDLNTPCEKDPIFFECTCIQVAPQNTKVTPRAVLDLAKFFHINSVQMRKKLASGFTEDTSSVKIDELEQILRSHMIAYKIIEPNDPREKYTYYRACNYMYSAMRKYM